MSGSILALNAVNVLLVRLRDAHAHSLASVNGLLNSLGTKSLSGIRVMADVQLTLQLLWTKEGKKNDIRVDAAHKDADDLSVLVTLGGSFWCEWEALADGGLDGG